MKSKKWYDHPHLNHPLVNKPFVTIFLAVLFFIPTIYTLLSNKDKYILNNQKRIINNQRDNKQDNDKICNLLKYNTDIAERSLEARSNISSAKDQTLESALACLFNKQPILSGTYTLTGNLAAKGSYGSLAESFEGNVELKARDGYLSRFGASAKISSLLSITEIYRGVFPDLVHEDIPFNSLTLKGKIKNGKLVLSDSVFDSSCVKAVLHGEIDVVRQKVDVIALVASTRRVVDLCPIVGPQIPDGAFVVVPVRIKGDLVDPVVVFLSPSAVSEEVLGVMKKVLDGATFAKPPAEPIRGVPIYEPIGGRNRRRA